MLMGATPDVLGHIYFEKMYYGIFDNTKIKRDVSEFECEYTLDKIIKEIYVWYESDEQARFIDKKLDSLGDLLVDS